MSEKEPQKNLKFELFKARLHSLQYRTQFAIQNSMQEMRYRTVTSSAEQKSSSQNAEIFTGEVMAFLHENLTAKLAPLHPSRTQIEIFTYLFDNIHNRSLVLKETTGLIWPRVGPYVTKSYKAGERYKKGSSVQELLYDIAYGKEAYMVTRWGVHEPFPHGVAVWGSIGKERTETMDFLALPKKIENSEEIQHLMGIKKHEKGFSTTVGVYSNGERIVIDREGVYRNMGISYSEQYYLLGAFDGEESQRTYWLYGRNGDRFQKKNVPQGVGVSQKAKSNF